MEKYIDKLLLWIEKLPPTFQVIAVILLIITILIYRALSNAKIQKTIVLKLQKKLGKLSSTDLETHRIFSREEVYGNIIDNIHYDSKIKTKVFKVILKNKLQTDIEKTSNFVGKKGVFELDVNTLCNNMISEMNNMVKTYEKKSLEDLKKMFGPRKANALFDFIMDSPGGFREKREERLTRLICKVDNYLRTSQIFDNNIERVEFFLSEMLYALRVAILEAEKVFGKLNGEIDKIANSK
ncbi:MAG: hypothetical protein GY775_19345 [Candidatus Scalindua sp.]|nr:hypothetical protein [Candidatus Scalindua sp.]